MVLEEEDEITATIFDFLFKQLDRMVICFVGQVIRIYCIIMKFVIFYLQRFLIKKVIILFFLDVYMILILG